MPTYKKGRTTPLLYLCKSKVSPPESIRQAKKLLEHFNVEVVEWRGGLDYDQEREEKIIEDCDYMLVIGPSWANGNNLCVGKGQMLQANAFTRRNPYYRLLIMDEVGISEIYASEATRISLFDPNNYVDKYAKIDTNKAYVNLNNILDLKSKFVEKILERGEPAPVKVERRSSDNTARYGEAPRIGEKVIVYNQAYPIGWRGKLGECVVNGAFSIPGHGHGTFIDNFRGIEINPLPEEGGLKYGQLVKITGAPFVEAWHGRSAMYLGGNRFGINDLAQISGDNFRGTELYKELISTGFELPKSIKIDTHILDQLADVRRPKLLVYAKRKR